MAGTARFDHHNLRNRLAPVATLPVVAPGDPVPAEPHVEIRAATRSRVVRSDQPACRARLEVAPGDEAFATALIGALALPEGLPAAAAPASLALHALAERVARRDVTVLICGPTGTGKEGLARLIHSSSPRRDAPLVAVNCAALPEQMLEALLFRHERGAFTGAQGASKGLIRAAHGGTLLLDEIAELPLPAQAKLLRALQEREVLAIGATTATPVDVRIVATANRDLMADVAAGRFRADLYYRLAVFPLTTVALRQRGDDLLPIVAALLLRLSGGVPPWPTPGALTMLAAHARRRVAHRCDRAQPHRRAAHPHPRPRQFLGAGHRGSRLRRERRDPRKLRQGRSCQRAGQQQQRDAAASGPRHPRRTVEHRAAGGAGLDDAARAHRTHGAAAARQLDLRAHLRGRQGGLRDPRRARPAPPPVGRGGQALAPKASRLNPLAGVKRMLGIQGPVEFGKSVVKAALLGAVGWWAVGDTLRLGAAPAASVAGAASAAGSTLLHMLAALTVALLLIAALDVPWQRSRWLAKLRMTRQEVRDEAKESDGNPDTKAAQRRQARAAARAGLRPAMTEATVVTINPTEFAVALRYQPGRDAAPVIVARGRDVIAAAIRDLAAERRVPVLRYPQLTRAIFFTGRIGQPIRDDLYGAVAAVLAYVFAVDAEAPQPDIVVPPAARFDERGRPV